MDGESCSNKQKPSMYAMRLHRTCLDLESCKYSLSLSF